ncbi:MAG: 23S rRNA (adenine(2503)-C(2))-methyltransferase RlmN [Treponema sp.]|nr:23S rRNA (adenine(2503)-C(2))-methyltransferase RlmN [Treponema sp.]
MKKSNPDTPSRRVVSGLSLEELSSLLQPLPPFRARQIFRWISRGVSSFTLMSDLGKDLREELESRFTLRSSGLSAELTDPDGTVKLLIELRDGQRIEAVLLSDGEGRGTACLSSQAGCPAGCVFCKTGSLGFSRNLSSGEIIEQFFYLNSRSAVSNIVIMGMGEPLLNLEELRRALGILFDPRGLGISPRRVTVSTSGIVEGIRDLADKGPPVRLALSLTSAREELRNRLMPIGRENPLPLLKEALLYYQKKTGRRVTLEAVLLGGLNTGKEEAAAMAAFASGLGLIVNLIPWNPVEGLVFEGRPLREPSPAELRNFTAELEGRGLKLSLRYRKGRAIAGACGQLGQIRRQPAPRTGCQGL